MRGAGRTARTVEGSVIIIPRNSMIFVEPRTDIFALITKLRCCIKKILPLMSSAKYRLDR